MLEKMLEKDYCLGGEQSGHIIFRNHSTTGDGILTALQMLSVVQRSGKPLSALAAGMTKLPQVLVNARVSEAKKHRYAEDAVIQEEIRKIESRFREEGRVLIRTSGTEPLVRIMIGNGPTAYGKGSCSAGRAD